MGKFLRLSGGIPRMFDEAGASTIYDEVYTVGVGGISAGTPITLPSAQTYTSAELDVFLNNIPLTPVSDFNYVSSPPRTQISVTVDLIEGDKVRFKITRGP